MSNSPAPQSVLMPIGYDGRRDVSWTTVMRFWWTFESDRPGQSWRYWVATAIYNSVFALFLTLVFIGFNDKATWRNTFGETLLISNSIGFTLHILFEIYFRWRGGAHALLSRAAQTAWIIGISMTGLFLGYTISFGFFGRNFPALLAAYPRAAMGLFLTGALGSIVWFLLMDGQTRRQRAETEALRAQEAEAALKRQASEAELRALQAQIEPHFLFNTLAGVQALIDYEPEKAKAMLEAFIEYLRATLDASRRTQATLGDELILMQRYLALMQVRMGKRLQFEIDADEALRALPFAPLLLQPLVENAIKYGLEPKIEGGTVRILAERVGDTVNLQVRDDGMGLNAKSSARKGAGVGLVNVRARLQQLFGEAAEMRVEPCTDTQGTRATLSFQSIAHP